MLKKFFGSQPKSQNRQKLVILGSGWGSFRLLQCINKSKYNVYVVSPRNHFLFTPLLASTTVGTLDFRSIIENVRTGGDNMHFYQAICEGIDFDKKKIKCVEKSSVYFSDHKDREHFELNYDVLVIGVGAKNNTFNVPGVDQYAFFLKELNDAREIRGRIIEIFEKASLPCRTIEEKRNLLHFVIVGAGPTGIEFASEFMDFFWEDVSKYFPDLPLNEVKITVLEAAHQILSSFDEKLVKRAVKSITKGGVYIRTDTIVKEVREDRVVLHDGEEIKCGMVIWSTGVGPRDVVRDLKVKKTPNGRILVDKHLRVLSAPDHTAYAIGDCAAIEGDVLPCLAQVAVQQGRYLAKQLNDAHLAPYPAAQTASTGTAPTAEASSTAIASPFAADVSTTYSPFKFSFRGLMLYTGRMKAVFDSPLFGGHGFISWVLWRSVYLTNLMSVKNRMQVPMEWLRTFLLGRDVASFGNTRRNLGLRDNDPLKKEKDIIAEENRE